MPGIFAKNERLHVETEKPFPVVYKEVNMACGYRADLVVEKMVIVESKSLDGISPATYRKF